MSQPFQLLRRRLVAASITPTKPGSSQPLISSIWARQSFNHQSDSSKAHYSNQRHIRPVACPQRLRTVNVRNYHSEFHPSPDPPADSYTPEQSAILSAALKHVPEHGFSTKSVVMGAREAGYLDVSLQLFPRGEELELVLYWLASRRGLLKQKVENGQLFDEKGSATAPVSQAEVEQRVRTLIRERLRMNEEIIQHWQDALAVMSLPSNILPSLRELYKLSSEILYLANDRSVDTSWYTRRLSVATVYASAEINMTEDTSPGFSSTMEFVERRINDANAVSETLGDVTRYLRYAGGSIVAAGRSLGMKV
ncbi:Ubiquinone biosynthesis protein coq9, mitochondrial [Emydomyces testavorans]|uniref:Ubiquinone biosynthesis protein n=1 Tax=Emydomyces testavorans TaxID=2070801 RepID=A0AAF0DMU8_9EURO|nr:Ubiquinone biosynthesis protein coq9, mitochondrial [Emydomyces testavorans]